MYEQNILTRDGEKDCSRGREEQNETIAIVLTMREFLELVVKVAPTRRRYTRMRAPREREREKANKMKDREGGYAQQHEYRVAFECLRANETQEVFAIPGAWWAAMRSRLRLGGDWNETRSDVSSEKECASHKEGGTELAWHVVAA